MKFTPMSITTNLKLAPTIKPMLNVSPLIDVVTGAYLEGINGEMILNGGIMNIVAFVSEGNMMKSTTMNSIAMKIASEHPSVTVSSYDTEGNFQPSRMESLAQQYPTIANDDYYTGQGRYSLTSKAEMQGDEWFEALKKFSTEKMKNKSALGTTPFLDLSIKEKKQALKCIFPSLALLDSLSEFQTSEQQKKMDKNEIDDKDLNTYYMADGMQKTRMLTEMPRVLGQSSQYVIMTAHVASTINVGVTPERKRLGYMRQGFKIKKVPSNFEFLTHQCWEITHARPILNSDNSGPRYPSENSAAAKTDLYEVVFHGLRNKSGLSGVPITLIVSQSSGVLFDLSHYHYLSTCPNTPGLTPSGHGYRAVFYPDELMMRTTVRDKLATDRKLARALELTAEIMLMYTLHDKLKNQYRLSFEDIYERVKAQGIDWNVLLNTRGYWLFEEEVDESTPPYLSGYDLLRIAVDGYTPHWYKKA